MAPVVSTLVLGLAFGSLHILGESSCPDANEVLTEVNRLNPELGAAPGRHLVLLERQKEGLLLKVFDDNGQLLESRLLAGSRSCSDWAKTAAILLVAWEGELAMVPTPAAVSPSSPAAPAVASLPAVERAGSPVSSAKAARWTGELGVGFLGALASDGSLAPGLEVRLALNVPDGLVGAELLLLAVANRSIVLGPRSVGWSQLAMGLGGHLTLGKGAMAFELGADALGGLLIAQGEGISSPQTSSAFDPGLLASARVRWRALQQWQLWLELDAVGWLRSEEAQIIVGEPPPVSASIPQFEGFLVIGASFNGPL